MVSLIVEPLLDAAASVAVFALEQGVQLFITQTESGDTCDEKDNNEMDKMVIYNKLQESNIRRFINLHKAADNCLKQIEHFSMVFETNDFGTSLDYMSDAWRALSGNNIKLFKECIYESYRFARIAKTKITKNPNHLLGVYSIIIFCGFCKFSEFGNDIFLGLKHIKDTLNEMSAGNNNQSLLKNTLIKTIESNLYWKQTQKMYIRNVILFSLRITTLVENIIKFSRQNKPTKDDENKTMDNESINDDEKLFGDMICVLFPNATLNNLRNKNELLEYTKWCPNIFEGRYFGGTQDKIFRKIDFFNKIHPLIFEDSSLKIMQSFIEIYYEELAEYLSTSKDAAKATKSCIIKPQDDDNKNNEQQAFVKLTSDKKKSKKVAVCLALHQEINRLRENDENEYNDDEKKQNDNKKKKNKKAKKDKKSKKDQKDNTERLNIPNKLVITGYNNEYDISFASIYCGVNKLEFDGCNANGMQSFFQILQNERNSTLECLTEIVIKNTRFSMMFLNQLLRILNNVCIGLKILELQSLIITFNLYDTDNWSDTLNLHFVPTTIEIFKYNDIKYMESDEKTDKYDEEMIAELELLYIGSKRKILKAMENVEDNTDIDELKKYMNTNNDDNDEDDNLLHKFICSCSDVQNDEKRSKKALRTMDISDTLINEHNFKQLLNEFICKQCNNMRKLILSNCGITSTHCKSLIDFYTTNNKHTLCVLELMNKENGGIGKENVITNNAVNYLTSLMSNQLKNRKDVTITFDNGYEKVKIVSNLGRVSWAPIDPLQSGHNIKTFGGKLAVDQHVNIDHNITRPRNSNNNVNLDSFDVNEETVNVENDVNVANDGSMPILTKNINVDKDNTMDVNDAAFGFKSNTPLTPNSQFKYNV